MNLTFSDPGAGDCGKVSTQTNQSATILVRRGASQDVCLDLEYVFHHPDETFALGDQITMPQTELAGIRYTLGKPDGSNVGWSPSTFNYSQLFYTQKRADLNGEDDSSKTGSLMLRAFEDNGCPGKGNNISAGNWYSWNCANEAGLCNTLPFSVRSILLSGLEHDQQPGDQGCISAVKFNAAPSIVSLSGNTVALLVAAIGALAYSICF